MSPFHDARDWFFTHRFGLFIHWGLYSIAAWHEQDQFRRRIPRPEYAALKHEFNPVHFDPDAWLDAAEEAGMRYVTFTTKHIDGFCMWDTAQTDYSIMHTPYGRDVLALLAAACHDRGFPLCLYYSLADMHHPNYPNSGQSYELERPEPGDEPDVCRYLAYVREQVRELCTNYGAIHGFWWDANMIDCRDTSLNGLIRSLQPAAVINGRGPDEGDFSTPERDYEEGTVNETLAFDRPTEACQAIGRQSWGYRADEDYYTYLYLMQSVAKVLAKGGNYLLNVGPMADGAFPPEATGILRRLGAWYGPVQEAFDGTEPASCLVENRDVVITQRGNTLYVILHKAPATDAVLLKPLSTLPQSAVLLNTPQEVEFSVDVLPELHDDPQPYLRLKKLPVNENNDVVLVVKLEFEAL